MRAVAGLIVVGIATNREELVRLASSFHPDVIIIDAGSGELLGAIEELKTHGTRVVEFAVGNDAAAAIACAERGIDGYVPRNGSLAELFAVIERVVRGEIVLPPPVASILWRRLAERKAHCSVMRCELTRRERETLALIQEGCSNKEIATKLSLSIGTVKNHVHHVLAKLGVDRRTQAATLGSRAQRNGSPGRLHSP